MQCCSRLCCFRYVRKIYFCNYGLQYCVSLLQCSLKKKADSVLEFIESYSVTAEQKLRMQNIRSHSDYISKLVPEADDAIHSMVEKHESLISLLCTIPGIDRSSAITILSEIGTDMSQSGSSERLCCRKRSLSGSHVPEYFSNPR